MSSLESKLPRGRIVRRKTALGAAALMGVEDIVEWCILLPQSVRQDGRQPSSRARFGALHLLRETLSCSR